MCVSIQAGVSVSDDRCPMAAIASNTLAILYLFGSYGTTLGSRPLVM